MRNFTTRLDAWALLTFVCLVFAIAVRMYFYINHKDLWLDEAAIAFSVYGVPLKDIFFQPLPNMQAAPLGFLLVSKALGAIFGYSEYVLYFLPLICGIGSLILSYMIGKKLLNSFGAFTFVAIVVGSQGLLYYTTEFKQYGIEAFCSFLMLYIYIYIYRKSQRTLRLFCFVCVGCIIFANTAIFVALAIGVGILYQNRSNLLVFLRQNMVWIVLVGVFFIAYYMLYIRFQRVEGFYTYWAEYFLPHTIQEYPSFIKNILVDVLSGYTPFGKVGVYVYMIAWCVGILFAYTNQKDIFIICVCSMVIYILLSLLRIYPFGHGGVIGGRLSLYMSPFFYLPICYLMFYLAHYKALKFIMYALAITICLRDVRVYMKSCFGDHYIQQTHEFIATANSQYTNNDILLIYRGADRAYQYYSFLDSYSHPYEIFSDDLDSLATQLKTRKANTIYIIGSHYPDKEWRDKLSEICKSIDKNAKLHYATRGWGSFLFIIRNKSDMI